MTTAMEKIHEEWVSQQELAELFNVSVSRIQDMKSQGILDIPFCKLSSKGYYYKVQDILDFMERTKDLAKKRSEKEDEKEE